MERLNLTARLMMQHESSRGKAPARISPENEIVQAGQLGNLPPELTSTTVITHGAFRALSEHSLDHIELLRTPIRRNAISFSPRDMQRQEEAHPRFRFWRIIEEATRQAEALPLSEQDINEAVQRLDD